MAYDERLAARLRTALGDRPAISERKMFGGLAFLLDGKMFCAVSGADLMVRVGPARYEEALARPHARLMDFTGRPLTGFVYVAPAGIRGAALARWVDLAADFVAALPRRPRKPRPRPPRPRRAQAAR